MKKVFMVCDYIGGDGNCSGRILHENGSEIGRHFSSDLYWLRHDLRRKLYNQNEYEIIDLIDQKIPDEFKIKNDLV